MPGKLFISLQDGFVRDEVVVSVDGKKVFHGKSVMSNLLGGPTAAFVVDVRGDFAEIAVSVSNRKLSDVFGLDVVSSVYVGISIVSSELSASGIQFVVSMEPFTGY